MTAVMSVVAPPRPGTGARDADIRTRAVDALLACTARHGLAKTTLDDVAREAGCARASLYRHFGGKRQLVEAAVATEGARVAAGLRDAADAADTLEDAVVSVATGAAHELSTHGALQFVLAHEAELVLPYVTFDGGNTFLAHAGRALAGCFERFLVPADADRLGEWVARITCAYTYARAFSPDAAFDLGDDESVRSLVRKFVLPAFLPSQKVPSQKVPSQKG